ncbi:MAG: sigma 54-interacting transcriptional regulator [Clostridiales Family XIII bacterium]|nr:sigma 54-interacting transcriptional regulator [Clostridiales Family XIII bacterium]
MQKTKKLKLAFDEKRLLDIMRKCVYDGLFITDKDGVTLFISDSYQRITGYNGAEHLGQKSATILKELGVLTDSIFEQVHHDHKPTSMMLDYLDNNKDVLATAIPIFDEDGEYMAFVCCLRDMTELSVLQEKLAKAKKKYISATAEIERLKAKKEIDKTFVAKSPSMIKLVLLAEKISGVNATVLIMGESGVGKDNYAKLIQHFSSGDKWQPFVKVSCGAIPSALLESELFGYKEGAFTGARKGGKPGAFELADTGIIFLDEVGELPLELQVKLLNVIQDREFLPLGGTVPMKMGARIIAATNKNLADAVRKGEFRQDLFYRLNVISVEIPPLRERTEDIFPLALHFLQSLNEKYKTSRIFDKAVLQKFETYAWPGNIRELNNVVERLMALSATDIIMLDQLEDYLQPDTQGFSMAQGKDMNLKDFLNRMEYERILYAHRHAKAFSEAAIQLGIDQSTLTRKMQKHKLSLRKQNNATYIHTELRDIKYD